MRVLESLIDDTEETTFTYDQAQWSVITKRSNYLKPIQLSSSSCFLNNSTSFCSFTILSFSTEPPSWPSISHGASAEKSFCRTCLGHTTPSVNNPASAQAAIDIAMINLTIGLGSFFPFSSWSNFEYHPGIDFLDSGAVVVVLTSRGSDELSPTFLRGRKDRTKEPCFLTQFITELI